MKQSSLGKRKFGDSWGALVNAACRADIANVDGNAFEVQPGLEEQHIYRQQCCLVLCAGPLAGGVHVRVQESMNDGLNKGGEVSSHRKMGAVRRNHHTMA